MAIATGTAIALAAAASAGSSAYAAHKASSSNDKATAMQATSDKEAIDFAKQTAAQRRQDLQPYADLGLSGLGGARSLLGLASMPQTPAVNPNMPKGQFVPPPPPNGGVTIGPGTSSNVMYGGAGRPDAMFGGTQGLPQAPSSGTVLMVSPDGKQKAVPSAFVTMAEAAGARRVG